MRKNKLAKGWITACLIAGVTLAPFSGVRVQAAEVIATVSGTVRSGTTAELLLLSTKEGNMEIKIDSGTDASACKVLLPGESISVSVSHGSDEYLHAVKITAGEKKPVAAVDSSNASTVTGTITEKRQGDILFVKTPQGDMEIKLDASTFFNILLISSIFHLHMFSFLSIIMNFLILCNKRSIFLIFSRIFGRIDLDLENKI